MRARFRRQIFVPGVKIIMMQLAWTRIAMVVIASAGRVYGQTDAPIEWAADRKLTIQDFKASAPRKPQQDNTPRGALSFLRVEASFECRIQRSQGAARAVFLPHQSWWNGAQTLMWERVSDSKTWLSASRRDLEMKQLINDANEELLKHEQLHFDMAEIAARKIRRRIADRQGACSTDEHAAIDRYVGEVTREYRQEQLRYDRETKHGTFLFSQGKWETRVKAALQE